MADIKSPTHVEIKREGSQFFRRRSEIDHALKHHRSESKRLVDQLEEATSQCTSESDDMLMRALRDSVFVGHTKTDMDSIASAIACAYLFDGHAARASDVNSETEFVLQHFEANLPPPFKDFKNSSKIVLVDHNQVSQMAEGVETKKIVGIIDHHALQSGTVVTDHPIYVDIRPWGSACSIVANLFLQQQRKIPKMVAGVLLGGILSDTLALRSPTTTEADKLNVALLAAIAEVDDCEKLAKNMFKAKSKNFLTMPVYNLCTGDQKVFKFVDKSRRSFNVGFGVVETTDPDGLLARKDEILEELRHIKADQATEFCFLAVVDVVNLHSKLLLCGQAERILADLAFKGEVNDNLMDLGSRVSRKLDYIPPVSEVLSGDFQHEPEKLRKMDAPAEKTELYVPLGSCCQKLQRRKSSIPAALGEALASK